MNKTPKPKISDHISEPNIAQFQEKQQRAQELVTNYEFPRVQSARSLIPDTLLKEVSHNSIPLATEAMKWVEHRLEFFANISTNQRSSIQLIIQSSILTFVEWVKNPDLNDSILADFATPAQALTQNISLYQSVQIIRTTMDFFEQGAPLLADNLKQKRAIRELIIQYGREIGFASAALYAEVAETRGSLDARYEAALVDSIISGDSDSILSHATALNVNPNQECTVIVGDIDNKSFHSSPLDYSLEIVSKIHKLATSGNYTALAAVHGNKIVVIILGYKTQNTFIEKLAKAINSKSVVVGPTSHNLLEAQLSCRQALSGYDSIKGWISAPNPCHVDDLLPERALNGDPLAIAELINLIDTIQDSPDLMLTLENYLELGSVEMVAKQLFIHANTVRYRLQRILEVLYLDPLQPRGAYTLHIALTLKRLNKK